MVNRAKYPTPQSPTWDFSLRRRWPPWVFGAAVALSSVLCGPNGGPQPALAVSVTVTLGTSVLQGTDARLEFNLFDGDFILGNSSATVDGLTTDGTLNAAECLVSCTGGPPYTISDSEGFGQFLQDLTLGNAVSFTLDFMRNFSTGDADLLVLSLLDSGTNFTLVDTNLDDPVAPVPFQDALLVVNLANGSLRLPTFTDPGISVRVPEPGTALLALTGFLLLLGWRIRPGLFS
jgi:hypothetical protein